MASLSLPLWVGGQVVTATLLLFSRSIFISLSLCLSGSPYRIKVRRLRNGLPLSPSLFGLVARRSLPLSFYPPGLSLSAPMGLLIE